MMPAIWLAQLCSVGLGLTTCAAQASGGHHSVDDAALLDPGQCEVETWRQRQDGAGGSLLHAGAGCRVGPVELALGLERARLAGEGTATRLTPQLKWAREIAPGLSIGIAASAGWQSGGAGFSTSTLLLPLTWKGSQEWLVHLNAGRDFNRGAADTARWGAALEWVPAGRWSFVAERVRESQADSWRLGARWQVTPAVSGDLSRARGMGPGGAAWWTAGLSWSGPR